MNLHQKLESEIKKAVSKIYNANLETVELQPTRKDFEGDITAVVFPMLRIVKGNPAQIGEAIGNYLLENVSEVEKFNVVQGFLNIVLSDSYYLDFFNSVEDFSTFGHVPQGNEALMVEYSSPNTNKPLHLGHVRNVLLGYSVSEIEKAAGKKVYKTQIINDRGIHICKSMLAWERFGNGETPDSTGLKGDKLVGNYYVKFDQEYKKQIEALKSEGKTEEEAKVQAPIIKAAQEMLRKWEAGDEDVVALWNKMNGWVYKGFEETYKSIGVDFDFYYYESDTYLLGKDIIEEGIKKDVFFMKDDGSIWCDLTKEGLDEKLVLRNDGTAVYMTQDLGTAVQRVKDHPDVGGMIYTVGNEQDYHFKVLFLILKKLGYAWADNLFHLSYGMVDLPSGKMKSREGTVVDADDLISQMAETAREISEELGKIDDFTEEEKEELYKMIGLGALKYYILKVDPKKRILFNPEESVDFQGNTGPFIQYTYARIQSILRKAASTSIGDGTSAPLGDGTSAPLGDGTSAPLGDGTSAPLGDRFPSTSVTLSIDSAEGTMHPKEKKLIKILQQYPETIQLAAENYSPALIANYTYDLVKEFNSFYQNIPILATQNETEKAFRVKLSSAVAEVIKSAFALLGIQVPERM